MSLRSVCACAACAHFGGQAEVFALNNFLVALLLRCQVKTPLGCTLYTRRHFHKSLCFVFVVAGLLRDPLEIGHLPPPRSMQQGRGLRRRGSPRVTPRRRHRR